MTLLYILLALLIFGFLIFIHELGHFIVARLCGVKVLEFAIGMGPRLFSWRGKKSGTVYALRAFPIGGFVNMLGENGMEAVQGENGEERLQREKPETLINEVGDASNAEKEESPTLDPALAKQAYCNQNVWKRLAISLAGPFMNILLGFLLMLVLVLFGGRNAALTTHVGAFHVVYTGEETLQGIEKGDYLYAIEGQHVSYERLKAQIAKSNGSPFKILLQRLNEDQTDYQLIELEVVLTEADLEHFWGSASEASGLRIGDKILKVNSVPVSTYYHLQQEIMFQGYRPVNLTVLRDGERVELKNVMFPNENTAGAVVGNPDFRVYGEENYHVGTVLKHTWSRSIATVKSVYDSILGLFSRRFGFEAVSGPIGITTQMKNVVQIGFVGVLSFITLISINLGVMNLLPLPALDGGHIFIYLIELIRRKPMKKELEAVINFVGLILILSLAVIIAIKDVITLL